jgi:hypothetical protein
MASIKDVENADHFYSVSIENDPEEEKYNLQQKN